MKMKFKGKDIEEDASIPGLFECKVTHEIKNSKGLISWVGPKIPPEVWREILSFFKWCYDTTKSECQVRLYVSPALKTWKAWAFPQEAKSGMTATELDNDAAKQQRAELNLVAPEWFYFGTVHHHCSAGAFQSSVDTANEENQDGLHITIGNMDKKQFDMHARFYRKGLKVDPDMSWFFNVEEAIEECPKHLRGLMPKDWHDKVARLMMCECPETLSFPDQWKENLIEIKPEPVNQISHTYNEWRYDGAGYSKVGYGASHFSPESDPVWKRSQKALEEVLEECIRFEVAPEDLDAAMQEMSVGGFAFNIVVMACLHHKVDPSDIERELPNDLTGAFMECAKKIKPEGKAPTAEPTEQSPEVYGVD